MSLYSLDTHGQLEPFNRREWLLTNGLGGFASSTVIGCNIRRYHGLLVAATVPPVGRMMTLSRIAETLIIDGDAQQPHDLAVNQFRDAVHPHGERYLQKFELEDTAKWHYDVAGVKVTKEVLVCWLRNVTGVRYTIDTGGRNVEFRAAPFYAMRDFHGLRHAAGYDFTSLHDGLYLNVDVEGLKTIIRAEGATFSKEPAWWYGHVYPIESDRGQDDTEDLFTPGRFTWNVKGIATITLWVGLEPAPLDWDAEVARRRKAFEESAPSTTTRKLFRAANDFVVTRRSPDGADGTSIIAGYPWFADWGRDTFISLPGLLLTTGKFERAKQVLSVFAKYVSQGMIPNRFDDYSNEPSYNTVDASLWFIHSAFEYLKASKDQKTFDSVLKPACRQIIDGYRRGTRFKIKMDESDGLIAQGDEQTQLTWMDAKCNGVAFTPRQGKPVEINALWYHALVLMGEKTLAAKVKESFSRAFWISPFRGLADVVDGDPQRGYNRDNSIRPNQVFAASLPNSPLSPQQQSAVVEVVRRELLTPVGLRTLAKTDAKYKGKYVGPQFQRDAAYHNGAIWPWLIGGFLDAYLRASNNSEDARAQARRWLSPLVDHLDANTETGACLGQISEIFEADEPHRPVGCCAQAWSVAETLRLAVELGM